MNNMNSALTVFPLCAFNDNYIWMWCDPVARLAWVVDPGDALPVLEQLDKAKLNLAGILLTHHHHDHTGGVADLLSHWKNCSVFGSINSTIKQITHPLQEGDHISCGLFKLDILEIPGHALCA